ncbi:MAG: Rieske 2Fe-2S domain-containing protein, partial [Planctomycetota bacterium]|nr:Rieske 2Fe-2S domain-containing protein [Planctomycetota bacterium]
PLGKGSLTGCLVTCPWHGWQFDVTTGQHRLNAKYYQPRFALKVEGEDIWIELPGDSEDLSEN